MNFNGSHYDASLTDYIRSTGRLGCSLLDDTMTRRYIRELHPFSKRSPTGSGVIARNAYFSLSLVCRGQNAYCAVSIRRKFMGKIDITSTRFPGSYAIIRYAIPQSWIRYIQTFEISSIRIAFENISHMYKNH